MLRGPIESGAVILKLTRNGNCISWSDWNNLRAWKRRGWKKKSGNERDKSQWSWSCKRKNEHCWRDYQFLSVSGWNAKQSTKKQKKSIIPFMRQAGDRADKMKSAQWQTAKPKFLFLESNEFLSINLETQTSIIF